MDQKFLKKHSLILTSIDGCSLGLRSVRDNGLIKKPWTLGNRMQELQDEFYGLTCKGEHNHTPCAGVDTKLTENYTDLLAQKIHRAFRLHVENKTKESNHKAHVSLQKPVNDALSKVL